MADRRLGAAARAAAAGGSGGDGDDRGRVDPHHDEPPGPPPPGQGLLPPALAGRGRRRALPRLARVHADRAAPARGAARLRRAHGVRSPASAWPRAAAVSASSSPASPSPGAGRPARAGRERSGRPRARSPARGPWPPCRSRSSSALAALRPRSRALARRPRSSALYERASRAYAAERWEDAAEYARHAAALLPSPDPRRAELLCVRGEALLRAGHAREAVEPFTLVVEGEPGPHRPQALHSGALAREAAGDPEGASAWRRRLREEYPETPWARRSSAGRPVPAPVTRLTAAAAVVLHSPRARGAQEARARRPPTGPPRGERMRKACGRAGPRGLPVAAGAPRGGRRHRPPQRRMHRRRQVPQPERLLRSRLPPRAGAGLLPGRRRAAGLVLRRDGVRRALPRGGAPAPEEGARRAPDPVLRGRLRPVLRGEPHAGGGGARGVERVRVRLEAAGGALLNGATVAVFPSLPAGFAGGAPPASAPGPPRRSRSAAPPSWGAGWPWRRAAIGERVASRHHDRAARGGRCPPTTVDHDHHHHHAGRRASSRSSRSSRARPSWRATRSRAPSRSCSASTCAPSTGPYPMRFAVEVDGVIETNGCNSSITFTTASASSDVAGAGVRRSATARTYAVRMTIRSRARTTTRRPTGG